MLLYVYCDMWPLQLGMVLLEGVVQIEEVASVVCHFMVLLLGVIIVC